MIPDSLQVSIFNSEYVTSYVFWQISERPNTTDFFFPSQSIISTKDHIVKAQHLNLRGNHLKPFFHLLILWFLWAGVRK